MSTNSITGVGAKVSLTHNPAPPVEWGRADGTVTAVEIVDGGTTYDSASGVATTNIETGNRGSGLTVNTTASAGAITALVVAAGGDGYRIGDLFLISGGTDDAVGKVTGLSYTN